MRTIPFYDCLIYLPFDSFLECLKLKHGIATVVYNGNTFGFTTSLVSFSCFYLYIQDLS